MAKYTGPKHRLARREGFNVLEKGSASLARRLNIIPGSHGVKGRRKASEFATQLREKQKARKIYGLMEKQFRNYFAQALKVKGKTGEALLQLLERRLDNAIFRLGFVPSRGMARQLVGHGHVQINGKRVSLPSYLVTTDEVISLDKKALDNPVVQKMLEQEENKIPGYFERKAGAGKLVKVPNRDEIPTEVNEQLIIEYYSR